MTEAQNFFTDGKSYERMMGRWSRLVAEPFLQWLAVPKGLRWLDVGCGNGAFTETLIDRCKPAAVVGVDPSEQQLAYARTRPGAGVAEFRQAHAEQLPFADDTFDAAVMALVITFVSDPAKAVAEMMRVVRPGGVVATYMWDFAGGGMPLRALPTAMRSLGFGSPDAPNVEASKEGIMKTLWQAAGLEAVETRVIPIQIEFSDFDDYWNTNTVPVGPAGTAINKLSAEQRDRFKAELRRQLPQQADGRIIYGAHANAVKGRVARQLA